MLSTSGGGQRPGQDSRQGLVTKKVASEQTGREQGKVGAGGGAAGGEGRAGQRDLWAPGFHSAQSMGPQRRGVTSPGLSQDH